MDEQVVDDLEWTTPRGKTLRVTRKNPYGFLSFFFKEGGELPEAIAGNYTNFKDVTAAALKWLGDLPPVPSNINNPRPELKIKPNAKKRESKSI